MNNPFIPSAIHQAVASACASFDDAPDESAVANVPSDRIPELLPEVMRIQSIQRVLTPEGKIHNRAVLYHERCAICVDWITRYVDSRLHRHGLATIQPARTERSNDGAIRIESLRPADRPLPGINLFHTVLPGWIKDRELVGRAAALWDQLPRPLAHLVNAVLWDASRFHRIVMGPSSLQGHHKAWTGNFRHSVEVAEHARDMGQKTTLANVSLLIAGGLLHDAAKAVEYHCDHDRGRFRLSERGELVGHRDTLIEWIAVARETGRVALPDDLYLALLHMLNAAKGAPSWLGLREPLCLEAEILSMADRLSGQEEVHAYCAPDNGEAGFGAYHPYTGHRTYVTRRETV